MRCHKDLKFELNVAAVEAPAERRGRKPHRESRDAVDVEAPADRDASCSDVSWYVCKSELDMHQFPDVSDSDDDRETNTEGANTSHDAKAKKEGCTPGGAYQKKKRNINVVTAAELKQVCGIGDTLAQRIVKRTSIREIQTKEQLLDIDGIGKGKADLLSMYFMFPDEYAL